MMPKPPLGFPRVPGGGWGSEDEMDNKLLVNTALYITNVEKKNPLTDIQFARVSRFTSAFKNKDCRPFKLAAEDITAKLDFFYQIVC